TRGSSDREPVSRGDGHRGLEVRRGVWADDQVDALLADELLVERGDVVGDRLVVTDVPDDGTAEEATRVIETLDEEFAGDPMDDAGGAEGARQGQGAADDDGITARPTGGGGGPTLTGRRRVPPAAVVVVASPPSPPHAATINARATSNEISLVGRIFSLPPAPVAQRPARRVYEY